MKIREMRKMMADELTGLYPEREIREIWDLLSEWATGMDRIKLAMEPDKELDTAEIEKFHLGIEGLKHYRPVQYITGMAWFYGFEIQVSKDVLIPRPETEELVHWILEDHKGQRGLKVLDIGTGSGCIALALAKNLDKPSISAMDTSEKALEVARGNFFHHGANIKVFNSDILDRRQWPPSDQFDIIVSNPPYIRISEKKDMLPNVLDYEPSIALFVEDNDPLIFHRAIAEFANLHLHNSGRLYFEINENLGFETAELIRRYGFHHTELKKDIRGRDRMIKAFGLKG